MGSANKYGNSFMLTDSERNYIVNLIVNELINKHVSLTGKEIAEFANICVSKLYIIYSKNNTFSKINALYTREINKLTEKYKIKGCEEEIIKKSYIGLCSLLLASREYDADGMTKVGKDNLSIYLQK